jgi:hypothetical protein
MTKPNSFIEEVVKIIGKHTTKQTRVMRATPRNVEVDEIMTEFVVRDVCNLIISSIKSDRERIVKMLEGKKLRHATNTEIKEIVEVNEGNVTPDEVMSELQKDIDAHNRALDTAIEKEVDPIYFTALRIRNRLVYVLDWLLMRVHQWRINNMKIKKIDEIVFQWLYDEDIRIHVDRTEKLRSKLHSAVVEALPKKIDLTDKFYGKSEVEYGFENTYNQCLDDVRKRVDELFGKEGK